MRETSAIPGHSVARCGRQRLVRDQAMSETATRSKISASRSYGSGSPGHSVLSTIRRSTVSTSCSNGRSPNGGSPRQRRKTGRSGKSSGATTLAGAVARVPRR